MKARGRKLFSWLTGLQKLALAVVLVMGLAAVAVAVDPVDTLGLFEIGQDEDCGGMLCGPAPLDANIVGVDNTLPLLGTKLLDFPDWDDLFNADGSLKDEIDNAGNPTDPGVDGTPDAEQYPSGIAAVFIADDLATKGGVDRSIFVSSNKNDDLIADWEWGTGNVPAKDDFSNVYAYAAMDGADFIFYAGLERLAPNGASHVDIEFNQNPIGLGGPLNPDGSCAVSACPFTGTKTAGDILIVMDFENGGALGFVEVKVWDDTIDEYVLIDDVAGEGCNIGGAPPLLPADTICAFNNNNTIDGGPWDNFDSKGPVMDLAENAFTEFAVNLSAVFTSQNATLPLCFTSINFKSRSSQSISSELKDFALGAFDICQVMLSTEIQEFEGVSGSDPSGYVGTDITVPVGTWVRETATVIINNPQGIDPDGKVTFQIWDAVGCEGGSGTELTPVDVNIPFPGDDDETVTVAMPDFQATSDRSFRATYVPDPAGAGFPGATDTVCENLMVQGKIIIEKQTDPNGDAATFDFTGEIVDTLSDGQTSMLDVDPGQYMVTESVKAGWELTGLVCDDGASNTASTVDLANRKATFNVESGETVKCTFTNTKLGKIIIEKQTLPDGDPQSFTFAGDVSGMLTDGQMAMTDVAPGQYTSTETVPTGWVLTSITCDDANSSGVTGTGVATFNVEPGEEVTCVFTNTKDGKIIIEKQTLPDGDPQSFTFAGDVSGMLTDGQMAMTDVAPGQYTSTETVPTGWVLTSITCDDANSSGDTGTGVATFNVEPGEEVKCTFTNAKDGKIIIRKEFTDPVLLIGSTPVDFDFDTSGDPLLPDPFTLTAVAYDYPSADCSGGAEPDCKVFEDLATGTYTVAEILTGLFAQSIDFAGAQCVEDPPASLPADDSTTAGAVATIKITGGETVTCTFTNRTVRDGCTPGFWKNHPEWWPTPFDPTSSTVGGTYLLPTFATSLTGDLLITALDYPGGPDDLGAAMILLRAATASVLNAQDDENDGGIQTFLPVLVPGGLAGKLSSGGSLDSAADIIEAVNAAMAFSGSGALRKVMLDLATLLDNANNGRCPLGGPLPL